MKNMAESVSPEKGVYRELTLQEIAKGVRALRKWRDLKRAVLAEEAGVSEKSLERLESGQKVSDEVYRKIAVALEQKADAFIGPRYIRTEEEAAEKVLGDLKKWDAENTLIEARTFADERDFRHILACWGALLVNDTHVKGKAVDLVAAFKQNLTDWIDIADEIEEFGRLTACRSLFEEIEEIERKGYAARFGTCNPEFSMGNGKTAAMPMAVIMFFRRDDWKNLALKQMAVPRVIKNWSF